MSGWQDAEFGRIPSDWTISRLGEICDILTDGSHFSPKESGIGFYMASVKDMRYDKFDFSNCKKIAQLDFDNLKSNNCSPINGDILISKDGANCLDLIFVYKQKDQIAILSSIAIARLKKGYDPDFYRYFLLSPDMQSTMRSNYVSGSAIPRVVLKDFKKIPIPIIDYKHQKAIAAVLSSLDDKIDLLHRQNKTLESMAETLFRQWFVEEVNAEWTEFPLSSIADFLNGLACQKYPPTNVVEKLPVLKIKELSGGISESTDRVTSNVKPEYIVTLGDVIFSWSGSLMVKLWDGEKCVLNQHLFKVTSTTYPKWFYLLWCKHHLPEFVAIAKAHATTMGHIKRSDLDSAMVLVPSEKEFLQMSAIMQPLLDKQIANYEQLAVLIKLRDTLLPKLMSGEVRVDY